MADAGRGAETNPAVALGLLPMRFFGPHSAKFEDPGVGAGATTLLEPVEQLRGRIDLVVVFAVREDPQLDYAPILDSFVRFVRLAGTKMLWSSPGNSRSPKIACRPSRKLRS